MANLSDDFAKFSDLGTVVSISQASASIGCAFILCIIIAKAYQESYRGTSYSPAFMQTLVLCGMVVSAVMVIIGSNIARAFSLVGALSIVRFRNAVKDPRDVGFIFFAMGVGMACGTGFFTIGTLLTILTSTAIVLMNRFGFGEQRYIEKILRIEGPAVKDFENIFSPVLQQHAPGYNLMAAEMTHDGGSVELTYGLKVRRSFKAQDLIDALKAVHQDLRVQLLGSNFTFDL